MSTRPPGTGRTTEGADSRPEQREHRRRADGERSYRAILQAATRMATERGLDGLSINELAIETGMSKGGLYAHFGSKEALQLATVAEAAQLQATLVREPALQLSDPLAQLYALCDNFLTYVRQAFPGGCFFASTGAEFDTRPGPVRDAVAERHRGWERLLTNTVERATGTGQLDLRGKEPVQLAFEINAFLHLGNDAYVLHQDPQVLERARQGTKWLLRQHVPDA
jgi:AcrR family transcriptional regulator